MILHSHQDIDTIIRHMPKIELHIHLEGAIPYETLHEIIKKYDNTHIGLSDIEDKFRYESFPHFLEMWTWKNSFLREYEDFEFLAEHVAKDLKEQGIKYVEMNYSPPAFRKFNLEADRLTDVIRNGFEKVKGIKINLIVDLCRNTDVDAGLQMLDQLYEVKDLGIIGIDLGGSEHLVSPEKWKKAYEKAETLGFHKTAHAGEGAGADSIWGAIYELNVERIGHGTRAIEDVSLVDYLCEKQIPVELCPISNVKTAVVRSLSDHPVRSYFDKGLNVFINTDDPKMFQTCLQNEYLSLMRVHGFTLDEIRHLVENAIKSAWCDDLYKKALMAEVENYFSEDGYPDIKAHN